MFQQKKEALVIAEQDGMSLPTESLAVYEALTLLEKENEHLADTNQRATCVLKLYNKKKVKIFQQALSLPYEGKIEEVLSQLIHTEKLTKPKIETGTSSQKTKLLQLRNVPVQTVILFGFSILIVCVLLSSTVIVQTINKTSQEQALLAQELLLSQLEADRRFDRAAKKMEEYGYSKKEIADMYLDNGQFISALKADKSVLGDVLSKIDEYPYEEQKTSLEAIIDANIVSKEDIPKVELRLALLNQDKDVLIENQKNIAEQELANRIVKFLLSEKDFEEAASILKKFPNEELQKQVTQEELESSLNAAIEAVNNKQKELDGKNEQLSNLNQQLDEINRNENEEERVQQSEEKQKEINQATDEQKKITEELENLKQAQEKAQKAVDEFTEKNK